MTRSIRRASARLAVLTLGLATVGGVAAVVGTTAYGATPVCVAANGQTVLQRGTGPFCFSGGKSNTAVAIGSNQPNADAERGKHQSAVIIGGGGPGTDADTIGGTKSSAVAVGNDTGASADFGKNNRATAVGDGGSAGAETGNNNQATAIGACDADAMGGNQRNLCF